MGNHYHLLIETPEANLSRGMRHLNGVYTQSFNRSHSRIGHLLQGRYKGILVEKEGYLLELVRYIVLNPVRSHLVKRPEDWRWSSHNCILGNDYNSWFSPQWILSQFGDRQISARRRYRNFVNSESENEFLITSAKGKNILGSDAFIELILNEVESCSTEVPRVQRRPEPSSLEVYQSNTKSRNEAIRQAFDSGGYTLRSLADHFDLHYSTVSRILNE
jgi:hypothetical protein